MIASQRWAHSHVSSFLPLSLHPFLLCTFTHSSAHVVFKSSETKSRHPVRLDSSILRMVTHTHGCKKNRCKYTPSYTPVVFTRGTKELRSHRTAPLETGMSKRMFKIIPVSQNNTMTHTYHLTSVWTKVNIRYKAPSLASPTQLVFILHTWQNLSYIQYFLFNPLLSQSKGSHFVEPQWVSL